MSAANVTVIELTHARLRPWTIDDAGALTRHANNWNVARNMRDTFPHPYLLSDAHTWLERLVGREPITHFAITVNTEAAGGISLLLREDVSRRSAEIGYWLGELHWGKGIATEAVKAIVSYAFASFDLVRLEAVVWEWNPGSMRVLEKAGFTREATLSRAVTKGGQTMDAELYALVRDG